MIETAHDAVSVHFAQRQVKAKCTAHFRTMLNMEEPHERLKLARARHFDNATEAARRHHWNENTYRSHENGTRGLSKKAAKIYGKAFKVSSGWLLYGEADGAFPAEGEITTVPLVGFVGAGAETHLFSESQGPFDDIDAPDGATEDTVAVEIRGDSLGSFFDRWIVFYDDVRKPMHSSLLGTLCIVGLTDGRILIKKIKLGARRGTYTLLSQFEPPIYDVTIEWAAQVKQMTPR